MSVRSELAPYVRELAAIAATIKSDYDGTDQEWADSPFNWIRSLSSRRRGAVGEKLVAGWLAAKGFNVARPPDSRCDRVIESSRVEIKFSTRWASGVYKFQQIRDQDYDMLICLGLCPFDAHCWAIPKDQVLARVAGGDIPGQHTGATAGDTAWLSFKHNQPPPWLAPFGGSLELGLRSISLITGYAE